ncbi:MAG TPA: histidine kinase [Candidatus Acidoferrum sp.]|nr:histidine kinase [Candidatus Acidoferrum sp.]
MSHLSDLVLVKRQTRVGSGTHFRVYSWHFWRVWEFRDTVVLGIRAPQLPDRSHLEFRRLEGRLVRSFYRLVERERLLGDEVRRRRGKNGGRSAIRQIESERQRLGRELHTGVGQTLAAIRLQLEVITSEMPLAPPRIKQALDNIGTLSEAALEQVRSVSKRVHPPEWLRLTLEEAIRQLWQISGIQDRFAGELRIEPLPREPEPEIKALLYRTMQESLSNAMRHARATRIDAELRADGERIIMTVSDNGVGFDLAALRAAPANVNAGIGLRSIRDLVAESGGNFDMESGPVGTKLVVSVTMFAPE